MLRSIGIICVCLTLSVLAMAEETSALPTTIAQEVKVPLEQVGTGRYRKFGFSVYQATLWAPEGRYDTGQPYALQLHYLRDLSKETVVDAVVSDVRAQKMANDATMDKWEEMLTETLSDVKDGDNVVAVAEPGGPTRLYFNGQETGTITDPRLSASFFNIWLGEVANPDLRAKLLASAKG